MTFSPELLARNSHCFRVGLMFRNFYRLVFADLLREVANRNSNYQLCPFVDRHILDYP